MGKAKTELREFTLSRDGDRPLRFQGVLMGEGEEGSGGNSGYSCDWNRGLRTRIYGTKGGSYILYRYFWSHWQGERDRQEAMRCANPGELLSAVYDEDGRIGRADLEALQEAASVDPKVEAVAVEEVE